MTNMHNNSALEQYQSIFNSDTELNEQSINYFFESLSNNELEDLLKTLKDKKKSSWKKTKSKKYK